MAEWRRHYKSINSDKRYMRLSFGARLMFRGLIDHCDDEGFYDGDPVVLKADIFPGDNLSVTDVSQFRDEVVTQGMAKLHEVCHDTFIELPKFQRWQQTRRDSIRPSEIKARIELERISPTVCNESVTEPLQTRNDSVTDFQTNKQTDTQTEDTQTDGAARKKRAPTRVEKSLIEGFKIRYKHEPTINREIGIALAQLVGKHGEALVLKKIDQWWDWIAPWIKGNRDPRGFIRYFDAIGTETNGTNSRDSRKAQEKSRIDTARYDAATIS